MKFLICNILLCGDVLPWKLRCVLALNLGLAEYLLYLGSLPEKCEDMGWDKGKNGIA